MKTFQLGFAAAVALLVSGSLPMTGAHTLRHHHPVRRALQDLGSSLNLEDRKHTSSSKTTRKGKKSMKSSTKMMDKQKATGGKGCKKSKYSYRKGKNGCEPAPATLSPVSVAPITPSPVTAAPVTFSPVSPAPITPAPVTAAPTTSSPVTPAPITPAPITAAPVTPAPVTPAPITPAPVTPSPITSAPVTPAPTMAAPVTPSPVTPAPVTPAPVTPAPITSAPVAQPTADSAKTPVVSVANVPRSAAFDNPNAAWMQLGDTILGTNADRAGSTISMSGDGSIVAEAATFGDGDAFDSGVIRVWARPAAGTTAWTQIGSSINGLERDDAFGTSLALSDDGMVLAIGTPDSGNITDRMTGLVKVFRFDQSVNDWNQVGQTFVGLETEELGYAVALSNDGSILAISSPGATGAAGLDTGRVRVYQNRNDLWVQIGQDLEGGVSRDRAGTAVALNGDGTVVALGSREFGFVTTTGSDAGYVVVYACINGGSAWEKVGENIVGVDGGDMFGTALAISDDGMVVAGGAPGSSGVNGNDSGQVRVFANVGGVWTQLGQALNGEERADDSGEFVDLSSDGTVLAVGAIRNNAGGNQSVGHVRVYQYISDSAVWVQVGADLDGQDGLEDFGQSVKLSSDGSILVAGAPRADNAGTNSGDIRIYQLA